MAFKIIGIKVSDNNSTSTDKITHVKLEDGKKESVEQVVKQLDTNTEYYYTTSNNSTALVESVHPQNGCAYIKTKANNTEKDNLLNLPKF
ncbi:DUF3892 domain-containing protein [Enterococcus faecalis]|uniref:DUF3892 domain-containing protein n=1 Tax=Enterococcus faecalis TaxID=1351 RepID=UPI003CC6BE34